MWDELLGYEVTEPKYHNGFAIWGFIGYRLGRNFELNARVRYHRFTGIYDEQWRREYYGEEEFEDLKDDWVFVLRANAFVSF